MENRQFKFELLTSLDKIFLDGDNKRLCTNKNFTMLKDEMFSFQIGYKSLEKTRAIKTLKVEVESPLKELIHIRKVESVGSTYASHFDIDGNYLRTTPDMYPDILRELSNNEIKVIATQHCSLWVDITTTTDTREGTYPIEIIFRDKEDNIVGSVKTEITIYDATLPEQTLMRTEWFHVDCLSDYYNVPMYSDRHWEILKTYMESAVKRGCNMILTPVITPSIATEMGYERPTTQLVDIIKTNGKYTFKYDNLRKWLDMVFSVGMKYIEICHFFSQWGAYNAAKIMATVDGEYKRIFGWETGSLDEDYQYFLSKFIPSLCDEFKRLGVADRIYFHISDEALTDEQFDHFKKVEQSVVKYFKDFKIFDTVEKYKYYEKNEVEYVVAPTNTIGTFLNKGIKHLWAYYCTAQGNRESNRFMAMPSSRTRIISVQLYKYDIEGFLHWGFNFYNHQLSIKKISPFVVTDAGGSFPSGDTFIVYPGENGTVIESLRYIVFFDAMQDLRAFKLLESLSSKGYVMSIIEDGVDTPITFTEYPKEDDYMLNLREKINREINRLKNEK